VALGAHTNSEISITFLFNEAMALQIYEFFLEGGALTFLIMCKKK